MKRKSNGFTLVELMVVITIIALLSSLMLVAMFGAQESAREQKTRSIIAKLDAVILPMYEDYRARSLSIDMDGIALTRGYDTNGDPNSNYKRFRSMYVAKIRLDCLRELQRLEMPDRWNDIGAYNASNNPVMVTPVSGVSLPSIYQAYYRRFVSAVAKAKALDPVNFKDIVEENEQAELLYLVVSMRGEDGLENFAQATIGDTDEDGAKEFLDGWNEPIRWLRWPAGFDSQMNRLAGSAVSPIAATPATPPLIAFRGLGDLADAPSAYTRMCVRFTSGALTGKVGRVTEYDGTNQRFVVEGLPSSPSADDRFNILAPDKFDARRVYPSTAQPQFTYEIHPLIFSAGRDRTFEIALHNTSTEFYYSAVNNNPYAYVNPTIPALMGQPLDDDGDGVEAWQDNITNHDLGRR